MIDVDSSVIINLLRGKATPVGYTHWGTRLKSKGRGAGWPLALTCGLHLLAHPWGRCVAEHLPALGIVQGVA